MRKWKRQRFDGPNYNDGEGLITHSIILDILIFLAALGIAAALTLNLPFN